MNEFKPADCVSTGDLADTNIRTNDKLNAAALQVN